MSYEGHIVARCNQYPDSAEPNDRPRSRIETVPPVSIVPMVMPVIFAITTLLNFDPIWFGVIMSINMEIGLITPPVGLNLNVVKGIAPNIP
ncbi:MAG: TRAP transporter large permease subunit, partial [Nocardioidaceae bacterium]